MKKFLMILLMVTVLAGCSDKEKPKDITEPSVAETKVEEKEVKYKDNTLELGGAKYSIKLPEEFITDDSEKDAFEAETEEAGIYIVAMTKEDFPTKEDVINAYIDSAKDEYKELKDTDFRKSEKKVGEFDSVEIKFSIKNMDKLNIADTYIIEKEDKNYIAVSILGYESFYEDTEKVNTILNSFKVEK